MPPGSDEGEDNVLKRKLVDKNRTRCPISEPHSLVCISILAPWPRSPQHPQPLSGSRQVTFCREAMNTEKFEGEGWRSLWLAIAGVLAITLTWNVLMLGLNGISY
jgi:hypothetical protein